MTSNQLSRSATNVKAETELSRDRLTQIFNTALVSTRSEENTDSTSELYRLMEGPAFAAVLGAIRSLAHERGISETDAARDVIRTFRAIDRIWTDYLIQEGVARLKSNH